MHHRATIHEIKSCTPLYPPPSNLPLSTERLHIRGIIHLCGWRRELPPSRSTSLIFPCVLRNLKTLKSILIIWHGHFIDRVAATVPVAVANLSPRYRAVMQREIFLGASLPQMNFLCFRRL